MPTDDGLEEASGGEPQRYLAMAAEMELQDRSTAERRVVECDDDCGAYEDPITLEEYKAAYEHWRQHDYLNGCSHGR